MNKFILISHIQASLSPRETTQIPPSYYKRQSLSAILICI